MLDLKVLLTKILSTPMIVEQGTISGWTFRKWSNGTAECWGRYTGSSISGNAVNNWYCTTASIALPSFFTSVTQAHANLYEWSTGYFWASVRAVTTSAVTVNMIRNNSGTAVPKVDLYIIGKWK